jgi:hypothetical protein
MSLFLHLFTCDIRGGPGRRAVGGEELVLRKLCDEVGPRGSADILRERAVPEAEGRPRDPHREARLQNDKRPRVRALPDEADLMPPPCGRSRGRRGPIVYHSYEMESAMWCKRQNVWFDPGQTKVFFFFFSAEDSSEQSF